MRRIVQSPFMFLMVAGVLLPGLAQAADPALVHDALKERFRVSRIEVQNRVRQGAVTRQGRLLILLVDGLPAKPFRVIEMGHKFVIREHVMDFARVEISPGGRVETRSAPFTLSKGTRLVVLDLKVREDRVHLLTHTADPLYATPEQTYGCTEFVFQFEPGLLKAGVVEPILQAIELWLE
jgi:hypothetical protein